MQKEIKNILKCLEMDMLDNKQIEILLDYITNLQKENEKLNLQLELYKDNELYLNHKIDNLVKQSKKYKDALHYQNQKLNKYKKKLFVIFDYLGE